LREAPKGSIFRAAIAYVSISGVKKVEKHLKKFIDQNGTVEIIAGIDIGDDAVRGIREVLRICGHGSVFIFWNPVGYTFHPKVYCLTDAKMKSGYIWIGSSNFTEKGLFKNYECSIQLKVSEKDNYTLLEQINKYFIDLRKSPFCLPASKALLKPLLKIEKKRKRQGDRLLPAQVPSEIRDKFTSKTKRSKLGKGFTMLLSHNDVSGKRFEPYFLIPVRARDENPSFWGWPDKFFASKRGGMPERHIKTKIHLKGSTLIENRRLYWFEKRDEFRFVSPTIYSLGKSCVGNILHVKRTSKGYDIYVIPPDDPHFPILIKNAVNLSSYQKKWGYIT
jgi:hypothetical protein